MQKKIKRFQRLATIRKKEVSIEKYVPPVIENSLELPSDLKSTFESKISEAYTEANKKIRNANLKNLFIEFDSKGIAYNIEEKPKNPKSKFAITGLYFYDNSVIDKAKKIKPSSRGELEITDINKMYMQEGKLIVEKMNRGMTWLDTGTIDSLHEASSYIRLLEKRQGLKIGCPEEVAWRMGYINDEQLYSLSTKLIKSGYGEYLRSILYEKNTLGENLNIE